MTTLTLTDKQASTIKTEVLVLLSRRGDDGPQVLDAHGLTPEASEHVQATLAAIGADGSADECIKLTGVPDTKADLVLVAGTGLDAAPTEADHEAVRAAVGAATRTLTGRKEAVIAAAGDSADLIGASAEGALYGAYTFTSYKSGEDAKQAVGSITLVAGGARTAAAKNAVRRAEAVADAQTWARDLVNTPPLDLFPDSFAELAKKRFHGSKVKVAVMDEKALAKNGCGGLVGVGRGSSRPPRLVTLTYKPARAKQHVAVVGKGVTFDSGGLCIKPPKGMITMKCDMAGAAAAAAAIDAVAALELPVAMTVYLCLAENMTGSDAQRPGDVVTMRNGKTVEIINTDAEGRLVMADGLSYASEVKPDLILDIATLTGAASAAFGGRTTAVLSNDDAARDEVLSAAESVGEDMWAIPLKEHLRSTMSSDVADLMHTGAATGGMIIAALFLKEFVGEDGDRQIPWAHLDIAGPAYNDGSAFSYHPKGATGHGVRTLVGVVEGRA